MEDVSFIGSLSCWNAHSAFVYRRWRKLVSNDTKIPPRFVPHRRIVNPVSSVPSIRRIPSIACAILLHSATLGVQMHQLHLHTHRSRPCISALHSTEAHSFIHHNGSPRQQTHRQIHQRWRPACVLHAASPRPGSARLRGVCDATKDGKRGTAKDADLSQPADTEREAADGARGEREEGVS